MRQLFYSSSARADHLEHKTLGELGQKLPPSFAMYEGKNPLIIVSNDPRQIEPFGKLQNQAGVTYRSMDDVRSLIMLSPSFNTSTGNTSPSTVLDEKYTQAETEAVGRIQAFWRSSIPKVKLRREYMLSPEAQAIQFYMDLGSRHSAPIAFRALLVSRAVAAHLKIPGLQDSVAELHKTVMSCIMDADAEVSDQSNEKLDDALQLLGRLGHSLGEAVERMSEENLGKLSEMQDVIDLVEKAIRDAEGGMTEAKELMMMMMMK